MVKVANKMPPEDKYVHRIPYIQYTESTYWREKLWG